MLFRVKFIKRAFEQGIAVVGLIVILGAVALVSTGWFAGKFRNFGYQDGMAVNSSPPTILAEVLPVAQPSIKILFLGDLMFDRKIRQAAAKNGNDYIFEPVKNLLADNDLVVANLEGPLTPSKSVAAYSAPGSSANYIFTFDPGLAKTLFAQNIRLVNLGNNHILNFGQKGLTQTKKYLVAAGVEYFGEPAKDKLSVIINISGLKIGFINYNQFSGREDETQKTLEEITKIKAQVDVVLLYTHWGVEYAKKPNAALKTLAHKFIEQGADLIIGTHSHVLGEKEEYRGKMIYYSLGNFIFDQYFNEEVRQSLAVKVTIDAETRELQFNETGLHLESNGQTAVKN